jgi:pimeloyl-ACP methyl ester carboxylesterase
MFSETRYALNGDLRVAYRASREGRRDIVFVPNWWTCCEILPELPSLQGWVEAMTSLGRLIFFDQPGTGASDPVTSGALPNLEQWADSVTVVLDDLGSREAVLVANDGALAAAALFAATHPSRTTAGANEVLVSSTLRDLVIGSGLEFEERGAHQLKGVPGEWRLFAVASPSR